MLPPKLPSDVSQSRILKALRKSGFILNWIGGKGSHCKVTDPKSGKFITVQYHLRKGELKEILKQAEEYGYDATSIMEKY
jgi:predicted RNA binding protein YcfA (HicA-like mRNA interferase family)